MWECRFLIAMVETETRDLGLRRPVRLGSGKDLREHRQHPKRRVLSFKHWIAVIAQTKLGAEVNYVLRFVFTLHCVEKQLQEAWAKHAENFGSPLHDRRNRWIVNGEKRERREYARDPRHAGLSTDERTGRRRRMGYQQVGALNCHQQILISVANRGKDDLLHQEPWTSSWFHDLLDHLRVLFFRLRNVGPHRSEFQTRHLDCFAIHLHRRHHRPVTTCAQLERDRHVGREIAKGSPRIQNNPCSHLSKAHWSKTHVSRSYYFHSIRGFEAQRTITLHAASDTVPDLFAVRHLHSLSGGVRTAIGPGGDDLLGAVDFVQQ